MSPSLKSELSEPSSTVWLVDSRTVEDDLLFPYLSWLSPSETQRYQRFIPRIRQRQFLIGHVLLRFALARVLHVPAKTIQLTEQPSKSPLLHFPEPVIMPGFSLSHTGHWIACAVSATSQLGLDIELLDTSRDLTALSRHAFGPEENAWFASLPDEARVGAFYQLWSTKEARYKLGKNSGQQQNETCYVLKHPDISVVLCSERELVGLPEIKLLGFQSIVD